MRAEFILEHAGWPAFVVDDSGVIRRANSAAVQQLGTIMEGDSALAASIWSSDNELTAEEFMARLERSSSPRTRLSLRVKGGASCRFDAHICTATAEGRKVHLFQLLPPADPEPEVSANSPGRAAAAGAAAAEDEAVNASGTLAHKQKLDCALQLTRTLAHDFNNALTGILGHTSLILDRLQPSDPWRKSLIEVEKFAQRAAETAQDLAEFSSPEKDPSRSTAGNLNRLVRHAVQPFQKTGAAGIEWVMQLERNPLAVHADEAKLQQAFARILENAVEAVGATGQITVRTLNHAFSHAVISQSVQLPAGRYVSLEVSDSGPGIPPNIQPRVFEPFFTTKSAPHRGLGLAWVYGIVTNHGGVVAVTSPAGQGATVRIFLPAQEQTVTDQPTQVTELRGRETVLVVDDEEMLLNMCQTVLSSFGYRVVLASNGAQALELVAQLPKEIHLVITDLVMPGMSGRELMDRLRLQAPGIPLVCMSGYSRSGEATGTGSYLRKPFTTQELLRKVREALSAGAGAVSGSQGS
jgi:signal transduction histidine kinase/ActR/RegA family two-component response regulator